MNDINTTSSSSHLPAVILVVLALVGVVLGGAGLYSSLSARDDVAAVKKRMETDLGVAAQVEGDLSLTKTGIQAAFSSLRNDVVSLREQLSNSMARATSPVEPAGVKKGADEQPLDPNGTYHTIRPGDFLGRVAHQYHTTVAAIEALNPGLDPKHVKLGQKVRVK
jgi:LysM repeat protein